MRKLNRCYALVAGVVLSILAGVGSVLAADAFQPGCTLPWASIAKKRPIDATCAAQGVTTSAPHQAQNRAKNELCVTGAPIDITFQIFKTLQRRADDAGIPFGSSNRLPSDRSGLRRLHKLSNGQWIGEGTLVRYVALISHPRNSNTSGGESVNCKLPKAENNDIHMDLLRNPDEPACRSITAEIIPHSRPEMWQVKYLEKVMGRPVRITGHLFFDASHRPCTSDTDRISTKRASIWEIHPVYAIDVCLNKTVGACQAKNQSIWLALDQWLNQEQEEDED